MNELQQTHSVQVPQKALSLCVSGDLIYTDKNLILHWHWVCTEPGVGVSLSLPVPHHISAAHEDVLT